MAGKARAAATSPTRMSSAACLKVHGEKASSAGRTSRSGAEAAPCRAGLSTRAFGAGHPRPAEARSRSIEHGNADHVVGAEMPCRADGDRIDGRAIDQLATADLDRREDSRYCRARVRRAHRIAARQQDALPRRAITCDCCARTVQVIEVTRIDDHRQELFEALRVEDAVPADRRPHELSPAQRLADVVHLVDGHPGRVRESDDRTGARATNDCGPDLRTFQHAEDADVREAECSPATEGQADARHGLLSGMARERSARVTTPSLRGRRVYSASARALARATVSLGDSPNNVRYWPAKRLRCQKPKSNAARVTGSRANGPSRSLRRTSRSAATRR